MMRYRVGRINGPWKNFVPPIRGGHFRTRAQIDEQPGDEAEAEDEDEKKGMKRTKDVDLSSPSSRAPSPVFDVDVDVNVNVNASANANAKSITGGTQVPTRRHTDRETTRSSSVSSQSTVDAHTNAHAHDAHVELDGPAYLDSITREKISLDLDQYPAVDEATQAHIVNKYRQLHERVTQAGLYDCDYTAYAIEGASHVALFVVTLALVSYGQYALGGLCLGFMWHQLVFVAHDSGHTGITHNFQVDSVIAIIVADFIGGLSMGWWKRNHNVHHIVTNAPEHDPDIEHMPLFAVSHRLLGSLRSTYYERVMEYDAVAKALLRVQAWTYYPLLALGRLSTC